MCVRYVFLTGVTSLKGNHSTTSWAMTGNFGQWRLCFNLFWEHVGGILNLIMNVK